MDDLKFDIYAMVEPKTKEDWSRLLDEALLLSEELEAMVDEQSAFLKRKHGY